MPHKKPPAAKTKAKAKAKKKDIISKAQRKVVGAGGFGGETPDRTPRKKKTKRKA